MLQVLNSLAQQLAAVPLSAGPGCVHCLLLHLLPTAKAAEPVSMGRLKLSWRRAQPATAGASTRSGSSSGSAAAAAAADTGPSPAVDVESSLGLPVAVVQDSLLSVKAAGAQNVTAGTSFPFTLQVRLVAVSCSWAQHGQQLCCDGGLRQSSG
jgi:hypothetical protein